jgi:hypothetical protein
MIQDRMIPMNDAPTLDRFASYFEKVARVDPRDRTDVAVRGTLGGIAGGAAGGLTGAVVGSVRGGRRWARENPDRIKNVDQKLTEVAAEKKKPIPDVRKIKRLNHDINKATGAGVRDVGKVLRAGGKKGAIIGGLTAAATGAILGGMSASRSGEKRRGEMRSVLKEMKKTSAASFRYGALQALQRAGANEYVVDMSFNDEMDKIANWMSYGKNLATRGIQAAGQAAAGIGNVAGTLKAVPGTVKNMAVGAGKQIKNTVNNNFTAGMTGQTTDAVVKANRAARKAQKAQRKVQGAQRQAQAAQAAQRKAQKAQKAQKNAKPAAAATPAAATPAAATPAAATPAAATPVAGTPVAPAASPLSSWYGNASKGQVAMAGGAAAVGMGAAGYGMGRMQAPKVVHRY